MTSTRAAVGNNVKSSVAHSVISGNTGSGLFVEDNGGVSTIMEVDHCIVSYNGTGFTGNATIRVSNTTVFNNTTLFTVAGGGRVLSYGNNQAGGSSFGRSVSRS
jgi:hypothetical protein